MEAALRTLVKAATTANVVWGWKAVSDTKTYPLVTLVLIGQRHNYVYGGTDNLTRSRVQVDVWGADQTSVMTIRDALIAALSGKRTSGTIKNIFIEDVQAGREESVSRQMIDIVVWHR